jgi:two-component sensor histidine kinase
MNGPEVTNLSSSDPDGPHRAALDTSVAILQRQRKLEQELHAANERLEALVKDKEALLHEVHHRVKNNLQVISSLLSLEARRVDQTANNTKAVLDDMQGRIRSMALLHESLYRSGSFEQLDLGVYLKQLCQQAFRAFSSSNAVRLELDLGCFFVPLKHATPAGLLVNELLSNCLKHAFPQGRSGVVRVSLQPVAEIADDGCEKWCLCVSDDGVGLSDDFSSRRGQSLGLQLVDTLALQMNGTLNIQASSGNSSGVAISVVTTVQKSL